MEERPGKGVQLGLERTGKYGSSLENSTWLKERMDGIRGELTVTPLNVTFYISKDGLNYAAVTNSLQNLRG